MNLLFVVFCLFVLLPNSMGKLIHYQCKTETTAVYMYPNEQLRLCFHVIVRYFLVLDIHL